MTAELMLPDDPTESTRPVVDGGRELVIAVEGDLDHRSAPALSARLHHQLGMSSAARVVIDLSRVKFIDSTGIGVLVAARRTLLAADRALAPRGVPPRVLRLLEVTRLDDVFDDVEPLDRRDRSARDSR